MTFVLGTATFGSRYGIANQGEAVSDSVAIEILTSAMCLGVEIVDTSPDYGNAENIIGKFHTNNKKFRVHTKISSKLPLNATFILDALNSSAQRLLVDKIEVAYFHNPDSLFEHPKKAVNCLLHEIVQSRLVDSLGASVYTERQIERIANEFPMIKVFQVPENILDQRLIASVLTNELSRSGYTFFVRSIFLQGLLLMNPNLIPPRLKEARNAVEAFQDFAIAINLTPLEAAIGYMGKLEWSNGFVVGANSRIQLEQIFQAKSNAHQIKNLPRALPHKLVDPRNWDVP